MQAVKHRREALAQRNLHVQAAVGLPEKGEDLVFLLQPGGLLFYPLLQHRIALGQLAGHVVQRHAELGHLVTPADMRPLGKIALADGVGHAQQLPPGLQQTRPQPDHGKDQQQGHKDCHAALHQQNAIDPLFGATIEAAHQTIDAVNKGGNLA